MDKNQPEIKSALLGDANLQYLYYPGSGPPVIMIHATGFLPWTWHPLARELAKSFTVIAPYFCDHRDAEPVAGGMSWMALAHDLCRFCQVLKLDKPAIVGHSMGATIATLAYTLHHNPARRMVLIEPIFLPAQFYKMEIGVEQHPLASKSIKRRNSWADRKEAREYLRTKKLFADWDEEMLDLYVQHGMVEDGGGLTLACSPEREAALFLGSNAVDPWPLLPKVDCPVLVAEGEHTENRMFIDYKKVSEMFPHGSYASIPGGGHLAPMERPAETLKVIEGFLI